MRSHLAADAERAKAYGRTCAQDTFAGTYIDLGEGNVLSLFTCDRAEHERELRGRVAHSEALRVLEAGFELPELEALHRRIADRPDTGRPFA